MLSHRQEIPTQLDAVYSSAGRSLVRLASPAQVRTSRHAYLTLSHTALGVAAASYGYGGIEWVGIFGRGESMRVGTANGGEHVPEPQERNLSAKEAGRRIAALRHVYDDGYISGGTLEALTRSIRVRVKRNR